MTLNSIVKRLEFLATNHKQVAQFYYGSAIEYCMGSDAVYPVCVIEDKPFTISKAERQTQIPFTAYFLDLVNVAADSKGNELEVLSDTLSIAEDFLALVHSVEYQDDWTISNSGAGQLYREKFADVVAGVSIDFTIGVDYVSNRCQVPEHEDVVGGILLKTDQGNFLKVNEKYYLKVSRQSRLYPCDNAHPGIV